MNDAVLSTSTALAEHIKIALEDGKAVDITVVKVDELTSITDYMIIVSGRSTRQLKALTSRVREAAKNADAPLLGVEGELSAEWILADLGDVVVHLMLPVTRDFYQLEKLWEERPQAQLEIV